MRPPKTHPLRDIPHHIKGMCHPGLSQLKRFLQFVDTEPICTASNKGFRCDGESVSIAIGLDDRGEHTIGPDAGLEGSAFSSNAASSTSTHVSDSADKGASFSLKDVPSSPLSGKLPPGLFGMGHDPVYATFHEPGIREKAIGTKPSGRTF